MDRHQVTVFQCALNLENLMRKAGGILFQAAQERFRIARVIRVMMAKIRGDVRAKAWRTSPAATSVRNEMAQSLRLEFSLRAAEFMLESSGREGYGATVYLS